MEHIRGLRFGPIEPSAVHVCVDMQKLFATDTPWASDAVAIALPAAREITAAKPRQTIFTRFLCPREPGEVAGQWQRLYAHCPEMMRLDPRLFAIVSELSRLSPEATTIDRHVFSIFASEQFRLELLARHPRTLIFSGVEADVCVLASIFSAIDVGYRVVVVEEAVASSNKVGQQAAIEGILPRFDQQIELVGVNELLTSWG